MKATNRLVPRAKKCRGCDLTKVAEMFYRNTFGGLQNVCRDCHRQIAKESARRRYQERKAVLAERKRREYLDPAKRQAKRASVAIYHERIRGVSSKRVA